MCGLRTGSANPVDSYREGIDDSSVTSAGAVVVFVGQTLPKVNADRNSDRRKSIDSGQNPGKIAAPLGFQNTL